MEQPKRISTQTLDGSKLNLEALYQIAPSCFTEAKGEDGELHRVVDFNKLRLLLGDDAVEDAPEVYDFTWVGKRAALHEAAAPINKTLRPCPEESVDWDTTENLYIEGDNLEVLKLLQNSYMGKVKMIYIDPPYNTGNDILYKNDYSTSQEDYVNIYQDENGNQLYTNTESNGRFHSDWCSMMYSRIRIAKTLIREDGFFAIAIDHNELFNIGEICDEVFGYTNRIGIISVVHKPEGRNQAKYIGPSNEFMLLYIKDDSKARIRKVAIDDDQISLFDLHDKKGAYRLKNFIRTADGKYATREAKPDFWYPIWVSNDLKIVNVNQFDGSQPVYPVIDNGVERTWKTTKSTCSERIDEGEIIAKRENGKIIIYEKLREDQVIKTHWINKKYHGFHFGTKVIDDLLGVKTFDFPKSLYLMRDIFKLFTEDEDIILDFFSGSATSAHAIMLLNSEDSGKRKYIMSQIAASCDKSSEAYKAGYKNICEIGKERIRRAGKKIKEESPLTTQDLDIGFRVFKCEDSNFKEVTKAPKDYDQNQLDAFVDNIKEERTDLDLLFDCMLHWGVELSLPLSSSTIDGCTIHNVNDGDLVACFKGSVTEAVVDAIAKMSPVRVVFRDSSFNEAAQKMNLFEFFKQKCDWTDEEVRNNVRVI